MQPACSRLCISNSRTAWTPQLGARLVREEYETYKLRLERSRTRYQILEESTQPDGSIIIKIKKQYNDSPCGEYFQ